MNWAHFFISFTFGAVIGRFLGILKKDDTEHLVLDIIILIFVVVATILHNCNIG